MAAKWAEALLAVQKLDLRMRDIRARLALLPEERNKLIARGRAAQARREESRKELKETELGIKKAESEIARLNEVIAKLRQQSASIRKNDEYQAMLVEIAGNQGRISELESSVIEALDRVEELRRKVSTVTAEVEATLKGVKEEIGELETFATELKAEYLQLQQEAAAAGKEIESSILSRYQLLLKKGQGAPVVPIENDICGNCHLRITPQTLNSARKGVVTACDNCMHLIYLEDL